jgi:protein regulator of cytokinesis 1
VTQEKKQIISEAQDMITTIRQMEASMEDPRPRSSSQSHDDGLDISYPLNRCLQALKDKHVQVSRVHKERFAQVKSMCRRHSERSVHHPVQELT